jgi:hypothetical protein
MKDTTKDTEQKDLKNPPAPKSLSEEYWVDKNKNHNISCATTKDEIVGRYVINTNSPLTALDTLLGKAFAVTDKTGNNSEKFYAIVLDKKLPVRLAEINKLMESSNENFTNVIAAQIIPLSLGKGRFFTVILEKPVGINLAEFIETNGPLNEDILIKKIIPQINNAITFLVKKGIVHGKINLNNIYIDAKGFIKVGECISEICGVSQPIIYENNSRAIAFAMGRGFGSIGKTDYYAFGVLVAILMRGKNHTEGMSDSNIVEAKLTEGTYKTITDGMELSSRMTDFLRGTINDSKKEIWSWEEADEWIKGRRFNLLAQGRNVDAGRPISFKDKKYLNKKSLAQALYLHWDDAKVFIRGDSLVRWIERSVGEAELAEKMEIYANRVGGGEAGSTFDRDDELLAQYILLLDEQGPIRLRNFSVTIDGISALLADAIAHNKQHYQESIANIMTYSLISYLDAAKLMEDDASREHEFSLIIQRCRELFRKTPIGFGIERCLYELNSTISCQSPLISDYVVFVLPDMLKILNEIESPVSIIDRQLAAFISMKLELPLQIRVPSLVNFPDFSTNLHIQSLALLSLTQQNSNIRSLPKLSAKIVTGLQNVVDEFHSRFVRAEMQEKLAEVANKGSLSAILNIISDTKSLVRDRLGFRRAVEKYRKNAAQIIYLSNQKAVNNIGYRYGLQLAVIFSFFMTTIVVIVLMLKAS